MVAKFPAFQASALDEEGWSTSHFRCFTPITLQTEVWVCPRADLDIVANRKALPPTESRLSSL